MQGLANCPQCGAVFVKSLREICPSCYKAEEASFDMVYQFLRKRENREATIIEIVAATDVEEKLIIRFVKENRLRTSQFPQLTYPCERCGEPIVTGKVCSNCSNQLLKDLAVHEEIEEKNQQKIEERKKTKIYYTLDQDRKKT